MTMWQASLETRKFSFEAYGETEHAARMALMDGLQKHAKQYQIESDWWLSDYNQGCEVRSVTAGVAYRDRESL